MNHQLNRRNFLRAVGLGLVSLTMPGCKNALQQLSKTKKDKPNIILIMADDMGYSDIGCYGGEIHTPNIDNFAKNGIRFTQFYNTARCSPTRASLMTGLYPHQVDMGWLADIDLGRPGYHNELNHKGVTIAEVLKHTGYGTYMSGKWHLTLPKHFEKPNHSWPRQRGFDRFFGTLAGAGSYYTPNSLTRDNKPIKPKDGFYYTDAISDHAADFIKDHNKKHQDKPYFLYVAYTAPHWPLHAKPEDIEKYKGKYMKGWDKLRAERYKRMKKMGIIKKSWPLSPREKILMPWSKVPQKKKKEMDLKMAIYAAQIDSMDQGIGRILDAAKKSADFDNTLILFLSDNGACHEGERFGFDDGDGVLGQNSSFSSYGRSWANVGNTPFRLYKTWVHEGGIAAPLIAHWPAQIKDKGKLRHQPGHLIDIMTTCCDVASANYPSKFRGNKITPMEGKTLRHAFNSKQIEPRTIYWEHEANRAVRRDNWKLVARGIDGPWQLYDLQTDRTELNNLAEKYPDRVKKMAEMWKKYAKRTNVLPLDGRTYGQREKANEK